MLLDTGSDVSLAPYDLIAKHKCPLRRTGTSSLKAANGSDVIIIGEATLPLQIAGKSVPTEVLVSRDVSETILGFGWLSQNGGEWQMANKRVRFGPKSDWIELTTKDKTKSRRTHGNRTDVEPESETAPQYTVMSPLGFESETDVDYPLEPYSPLPVVALIPEESDPESEVSGTEMEQVDMDSDSEETDLDVTEVKDVDPYSDSREPTFYDRQTDPESPVRPSRPARERRLPARYRD